MSVPVLTAVTDATWEAELVATLERDEYGVTVVRRCVDVADLLAAAATGTARAAVLSADLHRLDSATLTQLAAAKVAVVALVTPGDEAAERRLLQFGVARVLPTDATAEKIVAALTSASHPTITGRAIADPRSALPPPIFPPQDTEKMPNPGAAGLVVAIWGPTGAPGRSTIALGIADEAARAGTRTLLIDADTYGGAIAQMLGLLDESPGLAAAARMENQGLLDITALQSLARGISPYLQVLTGITRADRWPELRPDAVEKLLSLSRNYAKLTIVDCGFCLEEDEELSFDTAAPRRNGATLAALTEADLIFVIGAADPLGVQRLARAITELGEMVPSSGNRIRAVINKLRPGPLPGKPEKEIRGVLQRFAGISHLEMVPYDRHTLDKAIARGITPAEAGGDTPLRKSFQQLVNLINTLAPAASR
ncbi:MAG: chromosome partitioning protein [Corynebacteriales bacterium]|nr:chromosome partitioning protein [Mycobacteriales bacterium]